ncbi:hypothetical protein SAMN05216410_1858 [Sanguibacter gelidistatuariae]|uniref:Uncharacterized protein n=1 Tax=Sanguibacter gelidistatuariae TaxID=1814289 RepID=A0A1G6MEA4_9MICO|nr:hypothetical protein [Sanguibacter gelidistatuariae]SDC53819.1 hypothetical protein SAMN05216410_1858 [Sanguibacter gelidistatuariae]
MLGKSARESGPHARLAAATGGWGEGDLLDLGSTTATLATIANIANLAAVVHIGHPAQPTPELERSLLSGDRSLLLTQAVAVSPEWAWVGRTAEASGTAIVDEAGMRDCRHVLRAMGVSPHLVPTTTTLTERIALAGEHGTLVVERSIIPAGFQELPGSARLGQVPLIWYGLLQTHETLTRFERPAQIWLAFGPRDDHRGSLQETLGVIAATGIDLQHLRSQRSQAGPHVFLTSFTCVSSDVLESLLTEFTARGVEHRVLAVLTGQEFLPGPDALTPVWAAAEVFAR